MSDNWITLISNDPTTVPERALLELAKLRLESIAPLADEIEIVVYGHVAFFDCGGNFERVECSSCRATIPTDWWQTCMTEDYDGQGFRLAPFKTPCCRALATLNEMIYDWPQGFGRFGLSLMNPNIGRLDESYRLELSSLLGTNLRAIYQHL